MPMPPLAERGHRAAASTSSRSLSPVAQLSSKCTNSSARVLASRRSFSKGAATIGRSISWQTAAAIARLAERSGSAIDAGESTRRKRNARCFTSISMSIGKIKPLFTRVHPPAPEQCVGIVCWLLGPDTFAGEIPGASGPGEWHALLAAVAQQKLQQARMRGKRCLAFFSGSIRPGPACAYTMLVASNIRKDVYGAEC